MPDELLTIKEVAAPLRLAEKNRTELDQWIDAHPRGGHGGRDGDA